MERVLETTITIASRLPAPANRNPCLVQIYPTGAGMGARYPLADEALVIGRNSDCDICINDHSVSRAHARIEPRPDGYYAVDLGSTNGTLVNNLDAPTHKLEDGDYVRIGNAIFRFLAGGNVEAAYHEEIYRLTIIDALTEVHNKRYLLEFLDRELARTARHGHALALLLFDIDRFKSLNDNLGHLAGDLALRELAACVKDAVRKDELLARYGGEEFAVVLPETTHEEAMGAAERIRQMVEARKFSFEGEAFQITISVGVAMTEGAEPMSPADLIGRADAKLYEAKNQGRNRVAG